MALKLETKIMEEIGFNKNYRAFEGNRYCRDIRERAVSRLKEQMDLYHAHGEIDEPYQPLLETLDRIADSEGERTLEATWQAASEIIQKQILALNWTPEERLSSYASLNRWLISEYLSGEASA